jgi:hypothetical protein
MMVSILTTNCSFGNDARKVSPNPVTVTVCITPAVDESLQVTRWGYLRRTPWEVQMRRILCTTVLISLGMASPVYAGGVTTSTFAYAGSGTCLASPEGFNSKLEPVNSGVAWTTIFNAAGLTDANDNVTELGQSVDSASFGVGPRMHMPAAHAYEDTFSFAVTEPDRDGTVTLHVGTLSGTFTAGPNAGVTFVISGFELKKGIGDNGVTVFRSAGSPTIQTVSLANGIKFSRICMLTASISPRQ